MVYRWWAQSEAISPKSIFALCRSNRILVISCLSEDAEGHMTLHELASPNALREMKPSEQTKCFSWNGHPRALFCFLLDCDVSYQAHPFFFFHMPSFPYISYFLKLWDFKVLPPSYFPSSLLKKEWKVEHLGVTTVTVIVMHLSELIHF